jgi:hypothetical protein
MDFDGSSNALWSLFRDESKGHDGARVSTLKDDRDGVLIFSAALTAFALDSIQLFSLRFLCNYPPLRHRFPSLPYHHHLPVFNPSASDVCVNVFWFLALAFSLAALLAILVQQWVRDCTHVFQWYGDPLKSARLRQYLYEGCKAWYMLIDAEAVPEFVHISLFLFFAGLGDSLLNINAKVAFLQSASAAYCTSSPIIYLQPPYQNSFSRMFWYLF